MSENGPVDVRPLETDAEIVDSLAVMKELRPHLTTADAYLATVRRMARDGGYRLVGAYVGGALRAVAGYRLGESLAWGRFLYVDDLVTAGSQRSSGLGRALCDWLRARAREAGCAQFHLDSGVQRHDAHRFYLRERMDIKSYHFQQELR